MRQGKQSWLFQSKPSILSTGVVGGPFEGQGPLAGDFDFLHDDLWMGQDTYEKAESKMIEKACEIALGKAGLKNQDIDFFFSGDLLNQIISSSFAARTLSIPFFGLYGACSSSMEGLALGSFIVDSGGAEKVIAATSSHNSTSEKQYRYPTEYGAQKPPTSQWTVTGSGAAIIGKQGDSPKVTSATIGRVVDMGISDPFNMGGAMAPAAVDTIEAHFRDFNKKPTDYDIIATGDLGKVGNRIAVDLLIKDGLEIPKDIFTDCGMMIYGDNKKVFAGGSGCGCAATVTYGHFLNRMKRGELKRILIIATGALLSPMSYQQKETIPCVAHAVSIEM